MSSDRECGIMSKISWEEHKPRWFIARVDGNPISAFRFESAELNRSRSFCDQGKNPVGKWLAWVPGQYGARLIQWPEETPVEVMKAELIAADHRLQ